MAAIDGIGKMYIGGEWVGSLSGKTREITNPATGECIAVVTEGGLEDVRHAIETARHTFDETGWRDTSSRERARLLFALADKIEQHVDELARLETLNNGKPLGEAESDVSSAASCFRYYAGLITKPHGQTYEVPYPIQAMVVREPVGVCGQIVPWNFPLMMAAWKLAPCLGAGNVTVFKPSELTPLTAIRLFELIEEVGFPRGVANLVLGEGRTVGAELAASHLVDKVAFTGGTETGRSVMRAAAGNIKKVSLELGGKSPNIVFADADPSIVAEYVMYGIYIGSGQVCSAGSRLLIQDEIYETFMQELVDRTKQIRVGSGLELGTEMGPLVSQAHMEKVLSYIEIGRQEGATIAAGGRRMTEGEYARGFFVEPTILTDTTPDMRVVQEEIFGPVLVVQRFRDEEEAIRLANGTVFGLAGAVFTNDAARSMRVARKVRSGIMWVNTYHPTYNEAPWGGFKQSGLGRELGTFGLDEYTEVKQVNINMELKPLGFYKGKGE
ncbi:aldehyde dehydrogenase family protein [Paenibacillus oceani]|uniref:Aldehyde dehydrogenase family protein n=1 Tax=Paenibacillus oceani TaxID=2772510 RepID=A0A927CCW4_9BACL|nr:aldehyde dehydrogenase family protein [Paenibacillus oceani]MBD2865305.1 aldehyde dehydrogenase family protein [Paenibacillus oceani]